MTADSRLYTNHKGRTTISCTVRIDIRLFELCRLTNINKNRLLENAILNELGDQVSDDPNEWSEQIRQMLEEARQKEENNEHRRELLRQEMILSQAKEIEEVRAEAEQKARSILVEIDHKRKLAEVFERVIQKHGLTKTRIQRMIPEFDPETDHLDDWLEIEGEVRNEAREQFTDDEIRRYAKNYTVS